MTQPEDVLGPDKPVAGHGEWWRPAGLLTSQASATVAFTLAVLSMMGQGSWTLAVQSFFGTMFAPSDYGSVVTAGGIASLLLAAAAILLGGRVLSARPDHTSWDTQLARAAVLVGALGALLAVITILGAAIQGL
ncbi:MAG TPA: hypothetical protein VFG63_08790 [Nocardioidaceae bacterium]|nr:hypothetical protein [Nocardioidaceae bacterium]